MIDLMTTPRAPAERTTEYFFALDSDGRIAWPFRYLRQSGGTVLPQRWRFGHWVASREANRFLTGEDDRFIVADRHAVDAWIARDIKLHGLLLKPSRTTIPGDAVAAE